MLRRFAMIMGSYLLIWAWRFSDFAYCTGLKLAGRIRLARIPVIKS